MDDITAAALDDTQELPDLPPNVPLYDAIYQELTWCSGSSLDDEHDRAHVARRMYALFNRLAQEEQS
jgi:hypothetical protein